MLFHTSYALPIHVPCNLLKSTPSQWPENFDFDITRAINAPAAHSITKADEKHASDVDVDEKKHDASASVASVTTDEAAVGPAPEDDDLNPEALHKAFNFAAWSSIILVRPVLPTTVLQALVLI